MPQTQPDFLNGTSSPLFNDTRQRSLWRINGALVDAVTALDSILGAVSSSSGVAASWLPFVKTVAASGTPEVLGAAGTTFRWITFFGYYAEGSANTQIVWIRQTAAAPGIPLNVGGVLGWEAKGGETYNLADFWIKVGVNGEGVLYAYGS